MYRMMVLHQESFVEFSRRDSNCHRTFASGGVAFPCGGTCSSGRRAELPRHCQCRTVRLSV